MNDNLVKELKDVGFPQGKLISDRFHHDEKTGELTFIPSLEELIDECGDEFWGLRINRETRLWRADKVGYECVTAKDEDIITTKGQGKTPLESVANLYIAINKK